MRTFTIIWIGQLVSTIGSGLTNFAIAVWVYRRTGSATQFTMVALFGALPSILISPLTGALADRWNRRRTMIFSNLGSGLTTLAIVLLLYANRLEFWHVCLFIAARSAISSFMFPAFSAATTLLVPKHQLGRASGMSQTSQASAQILAPLFAGALIALVPLERIVLIDFSTYIFGVVTLLLVTVPEPLRNTDGQTARRSLFKEALYGWTYIRERPGLFVLLIYFAAINFIIGISGVLFTPMVLSFASPQVLGTILSISGIGFLAGSLVMSAWGGPKNHVHGVLFFGLLMGLSVLLAGLKPYVPLVAAALFGMYFTMPLINGCSQAIWQSKTAVEVQGRVFALRRMVSWSITPLAYIIAGPLADKVFEPLMSVGGPLSGSVGHFLGVGPGRGIGMLFVTTGFLTLLIPIGAYFYPRLRLMEYELPDATVDHAVSRP
jgi:MFS family permease